MVGDRVATLARNSAEPLLLQLGCARIGAIYVPLNWRLTAPEIAALIEDTGPTVLIGDAECARARLDGLSIDAVRGEIERAKPLALEPIGGLTAIFTGGAPHPAPAIREWLTDGIAMVDGFGMSEAGTVFGMSVDPALIALRAGSVGFGTPGIDARIVDDVGMDVAAGMPGELLLKGDNIFHGYWRRSDAQDAAFTADGCFRTGDIAVCDRDGYYTLVDRKKKMFISGGENVYSAEIEAALAGTFPDLPKPP